MKTQSPAPQTYIALLRGINVGGHNRLPMVLLAAMFEDAGCQEVRTYIQSGNVVFRAPSSAAQQIRWTVQAKLAAITERRIPIILRTGEELQKIVEENPFQSTEPGFGAVHVGFLVNHPPSERIASLDPDRSPPDMFAVRGSEIYLQLPNGMARTRLTNVYFDTILGTPVTFRNWRTVQSLLKMTRAFALDSTLARLA